jgi:hypothetical protein
MQVRTSRAVVILLFLVSCTEVRSYMPCTQKSDCDYDGCNALSKDWGCETVFGYSSCIYGGFSWWENCPERPCLSGTFNNNSAGYVDARGYIRYCSKDWSAGTPAVDWRTMDRNVDGGIGRGGGTACSCESCPAGKYSKATGATVCVDCGAGKYSNATKGATVCVDCVAGKYSESIGGLLECSVMRWPTRILSTLHRNRVSLRLSDARQGNYPCLS